MEERGTESWIHPETGVSPIGTGGFKIQNSFPNRCALGTEGFKIPDSKIQWFSKRINP